MAAALSPRPCLLLVCADQSQQVAVFSRPFSLFLWFPSNLQSLLLMNQRQPALLLCVTLLLCFPDDLDESLARAPSVPSPGSCR